MPIGKGALIWSQAIAGSTKWKSKIVITSFRSPFESDVSSHDGRIGYYLGTENKKRKRQYHGHKRTGYIKFDELRHSRVRFVDTKNKIVIKEGDYDWDFDYTLLIDTDKNYNKIKAGILSVAKKNGIKIIGNRKLKTIKKKTATKKKSAPKRKSPAKKKKRTKRKTTRKKK